MEEEKEEDTPGQLIAGSLGGLATISFILAVWFGASGGILAGLAGLSGVGWVLIGVTLGATFKQTLKLLAIIAVLVGGIAFGPGALFGYLFDDDLERQAREGTRERELGIVLAPVVRAAGYRCDSVSSAVPMVFARGFNVYCNNFLYSYEIEDVGGNWVVTVD